MALEMLREREIDVYVGDQLLKTIKRHVRRNDPYYPMRGAIEVQKREWVKVHACSRGPEYPRWRLYVEEAQGWVNPENTIKK
jgi:hypothetical protein